MSGLLLPWREYWPAAFADADTAKSLLTTHAGDAAAALVSLANTNYAVVSFVDGAPNNAQFTVRLPADLYPAGGLTLTLSWFTPASSGSARWTIYGACVMPIDGDQDDLDPALDDPIGTVVTPAAAAANCLIESAIPLTVPDLRSGGLLYLYFFRDPADADDDLGDVAHMLGFELTYRRRVVLA